MSGARFQEGDLVRLVQPVKGERGNFPRGSEARVLLAFGAAPSAWVYDLAVYGDVCGALFEVPHDSLTEVERRRARG